MFDKQLLIAVCFDLNFTPLVGLLKKIKAGFGLDLRLDSKISYCNTSCTPGSSFESRLRRENLLFNLFNSVTLLNYDFNPERQRFFISSTIVIKYYKISDLGKSHQSSHLT
ncbi:hypothetical protein BpHYR1_027672 [Brachionus plicatilis]|uniref:Uncharacterized protein n=1 Tax=Brachionus plicatilis TaxID=10195 RepID=A0A3M7QCX7_BRAPC|nr:hypothetical protein BpHYR1_027672 [Brachionus plicatilis]